MTMKTITAVGYARRSTDMQERSIPDQQAYVERWANEHRYVVARWYIDDAISGTSTKGRDQFEQMIADAENGRDFDAVLIYDISRFSRGGTNETGYYIHRLKMAGVESIFCAEGIPEGDEGELLQGVKSWQARQYSVKLSRDTLRGQISNIMERHCAPGGAPPFGYDKQHLAANGQVLRTFRYLSDGRKEEYDTNGRLVRVLPPGETVKKAKSDIVRYAPSTSDRVAIIRRIFGLVAEGYGSRHIAARLNDDSIPTPDGKKWSSSQIRKIVVNPVYCGALAWNRKTEGKLHGVGRDGKLRPRKGNYTTRSNARADWYVVDDVHEPLVSKELFAKVRQIQDSRRHMGGRAKTGNRSLLSGLIVCKHCGWHFGQWRNTVYNRRHDRRDRYRYYVDRGYHTGGTAVCRSTNIPADALDEFILDLMRQTLLGLHETAKTAVDGFVKKVLAAQKQAPDHGAAAKELDSLTKRIQATVSMLTDPAFENLEELKTTLATLKVRRDKLQEALEKATPSGTTYDEPTLRKWAMERLEALEKALAKELTTMDARRLVHSVVQKIEIDPEAHSGTVYLSPDMHGLFLRETSTIGTLGDTRGGVKSKGEA